MVIMQNKTGQLANRLFAFAHFIANAVEHRYSLVNPTFDEYEQYFPATRTNDFRGLPVSVRLMPGLSYPLFRLVSELAARLMPRSGKHEFIRWHDQSEFDLNAPDFVEKARSKTIVVNGWLFRDHINLQRHADRIRSIFTPTQDVRDEAAALLAKARQMGEVVVGVHIRRGDYRHWNGGRYYFPDDFYHEAMAQAESCFSSVGKRVVFLVCSNEMVSAAAFAPFHLVLGAGKEIVDLYSLAACDFIIGPPSTYSGWAAYYGDVPLMYLVDREHIPMLRDFFCGMRKQESKAGLGASAVETSGPTS